MDQAHSPSPYFIRRTAPPDKGVIDLQEFSVVEEQVHHPLKDYWLVVKRHRWLVLLCAFAVTLCAALHTFTRTPLYTAETTLLIERKAPQFLKLQDARGELVDSNNEFYKTQYEILKSPSFAERVIREEGLQSDPSFVGVKDDASKNPGLVNGVWGDFKKWAGGFIPSKPAVKNSDPATISPGLASAYLAQLAVRPVSGTSLVQIAFTTPDPALSARLANAHASAYSRYGTSLRSETNEEATQFLQQKLAELKERVEQSEAALNSYRRDKGIISVDDKENVVVERLLDLNKSVTAAEGERIAVESKFRAIRGRTYDELPAVLNSLVINALKADLGKLEAEWLTLSKEFKPGYPRLDDLKARLEETRRRLRSEVQNEVKGIETAYQAAKTREVELRRQMDEQKQSTLNLKDSAVQYAILAG
jgi:GumC protein